MRPAPSNTELIEALAGEVDGQRIVALERRPYIYATSAPLEELRVATADGAETLMILKDLERDRLLGDARTSKPEAVYEPRREIEAYRSVLGPAGIGARCFAAVSEGDRHWLLVEKVPGVELWQIGELEIWEGVAAWLGAVHARFEGRTDELRGANPYLLDHTRDWYTSWRDRAIRAVTTGGDHRASELADALNRYGEVAGELATAPRTLLHGELYPANILVVLGTEPVGIYPVDWEMAATGPGAVDLAALTGGWSDGERNRLVAAYADGIADGNGCPPDPSRLARDLTRARLHMALQWLGWSSGWEPPAEHANDWLGEALAVAKELGLA